ncbi:hypothetical protein DV736_g4776, partial [Chaetothyriales sp. CBS 134916]
MADSQNSPILVQLPTPPHTLGPERGLATLPSPASLMQRAEEQNNTPPADVAYQQQQDTQIEPDADTPMSEVPAPQPENEAAREVQVESEPIQLSQTADQPVVDVDPPEETAVEATGNEPTTGVPAVDIPNPSPDAPQTNSPKQSSAPQTEPELPEWVTWEEDTSAPTGEEMREYEGTDAYLSALDVAAHEKKMFCEWPDPDQRPVKKIRLSWVIKGVRGTKERPNMATVMHSPAATFAYFEGPPDANVGEGAEPKEVVKTEPTPVKKEDKTDGEAQSPETADKTAESESVAEQPLPTTSQDAQEAHGVEHVSDGQGEADTIMDANPAVQGKDDTPTSAKDDDFRVAAQLGMVIYNPQEPRTSTCKSSEHQFNQYNDDWGWLSFVGPWKDIHKRQRGQFQALLRNDTLAIDAYILIFDDPTQALWWHGSEKHEAVWPSKRLAGYYPMGMPPRHHSPAVAGLTCWFLLAPFRRILQTVDAGKWRLNSQARPRPLIAVLQWVLHTMRRLTKDNYVDVSKSIEVLKDAGETCSDVISFWEVLRRSIELEIVEDNEALTAISDIFDIMGETVKVPALPVEGVEDIQQALQKVIIPGPMRERGPKFLPLALKRETFDQTRREWKLHYDRVVLNEEIEIPGSGEKYALYGFVVHVAERNSGEFYCILRPNGPGTKWLAFEDRDGNKVLSYTRYKLNEFEGLEGDALANFKGTRGTAYLAMYIKASCVTELLSGGLEDYEAPSWILPALERNVGSEEKTKGNEEAMVDVEVYHDDGMIGRPGLLDMFNMKTQTHGSPSFKKYTFPRSMTFYAVRRKLAEDYGLDNPQKLRIFIMGNDLMGQYTNLQLGNVRLKRTIADNLTAVRPLCLWCSTLKTEADADLFGYPDKKACIDVTPEAPPAAPAGEETITWDPAPVITAEQVMEAEFTVTEASPDHDTSAESGSLPVAALEMQNSPDIVMEDAPAERSATDTTPESTREHGHLIDAIMSEDNNTSTETPTRSTSLADQQASGLDANAAESLGGMHHTEVQANDQDMSYTGEAAIVALIEADAAALELSHDAVDQQLSQPSPDPVSTAASTDAAPVQAPVVPETASTDERAAVPVLRTHPVYNCYGFLQLFDADMQDFVIHSTFFTKREEPVKDAIRRCLGYDKEKSFHVWHREFNLGGSPITDKVSFNDVNFVDGMAIVVGEILGEKKLVELRQQGKFSDPFILSQYIRLRERRHPIQSLTTSEPVEISDFGGEYFRGPLVKGQPHGPNCTTITTQGHTYTGPMVMSQKSGNCGKMIYQNGDAYEGGWLDDERHGQGTLVQRRTGNKYVGGFMNGKRWGKGMTHWEMADEEASMCQICYGGEVDALFYDCGHELGQEIRTAVHGVVGIGDVIRGTVNSSIDDLFPDKETEESRAKNSTVTNQGYADVEAAEKLFAAHRHHHGSGVGSHQGTTHDAVTTEATPVAQEPTGTMGETATSTGTGASVNPGVEKQPSGVASIEGRSGDNDRDDGDNGARK